MFWCCPAYSLSSRVWKPLRPHVQDRRLLKAVGRKLFPCDIRRTDTEKSRKINFLIKWNFTVNIFNLWFCRNKYREKVVVHNKLCHYEARYRSREFSCCNMWRYFQIHDGWTINLWWQSLTLRRIPVGVATENEERNCDCWQNILINVEYNCVAGNIIQHKWNG